MIGCVTGTNHDQPYGGDENSTCSSESVKPPRLKFRRFSVSNERLHVRYEYSTQNKIRRSEDIKGDETCPTGMNPSCSVRRPYLDDRCRSQDPPIALSRYGHCRHDEAEGNERATNEVVVLDWKRRDRRERDRRASNARYEKRMPVCQSERHGWRRGCHGASICSSVTVRQLNIETRRSAPRGDYPRKQPERVGDLRYQAPDQNRVLARPALSSASTVGRCQP